MRLIFLLLVFLCGCASKSEFAQEKNIKTKQEKMHDSIRGGSFGKVGGNSNNFSPRHNQFHF